MRMTAAAWVGLGAVIVAGNAALLVAGRDGPRPGRRPGIISEFVLPLRPPTPEERAWIAAPPPATLTVASEPGARVLVLPERRATRSPFGGRPLATGTTGADGRWSGALASRVRARVRVEKEGYAPGEAPADDPLVAVPLEREGILRGRAVEEKGGAPVAGAAVVAKRDGSRTLEATTGEDGSFALRGLAPGKWRVEASTPRLPPGGTTVEVAPGSEESAEIRLPKGFTLRGRVTIPGSGRIVEAGTISTGGRTAPLGEGGRFVLEGLPGPVQGFVVDTGGVVYRVQGQRAILDGATGEQVGEVEVPLPGTMQANLPFRGVARGEEGPPLEGVRVIVGTYLLRRLATIERGPDDAWSGEALTDGEGRFTVTSARGGREILATRPGYAPTLLLLPSWSRNRTYDLVLNRGFRALVRVIDADGKPVPGAEVYALMRHPDGARQPADYADVLEALGAHSLTDGEGRAAVGPLGPGAWYLRARSPDGVRGLRAALSIPPGTREGAVELRLRPLPSVAGRVVDGAGKPLAGVLVNAMLDSTLIETRASLTDADGRFRWDGLLLSPEVEATGVLTVETVGGGAGARVPIPLGGEEEIVVRRP